MQQIRHMFKKELKAYFISPIAYIVIAIFLIVAGWFFFSPFFIRGQATMRYFFELLPFIFSFVVPAVTMKLFAEELNTGSYELLMTLPVNFRQVLIAKLLAGTVFTALMLLPTVAYPVCIAFVGDLDWGPVIGGYLGALFLGFVFSSIGLFASALTKNQIIAFIIAAAICFALTILEALLFFLPLSIVDFLAYLSVTVHFDNISKGVVDSRDIVYFLSVSFVSLYGAYLVLSEKQ
ncbi:MAG: ABC transporter permease subunit [Thermodesulfobacteriota bacterium]|nr:ABC transporter permease subunit [Thermodesulfobacteriota bacterium]